MVELIYDVHASESGALSILDDLYLKLRNDLNKDNRYVFIVSTPQYENTENISVERYPWVKKSWFHRIYFDMFTTRKILKKYKPDKIYSLQNKGVSFFHGEQDVYLHLPFVLCDYRFDLKKDGKRLWIYQNVLSKSIFRSLRKVNKVIVQTYWMKEALMKKAGVEEENIIIQAPDIKMNVIGAFINTPQNRKRFFYPATAFNYKNHATLLEAIKYAVDSGLEDYEVIFTLNKAENSYTESLYSYVKENRLNVKFIGKIPRDKVFDLYTKSVLLFPSFVESFGMPLLEGRMSNTFIIASSCPFSKEILDGYDRALFFEAYDYKKMAEHILKVAMDGEETK